MKPSNEPLPVIFVIFKLTLSPRTFNSNRIIVIYRVTDI